MTISMKALFGLVLWMLLAFVPIKPANAQSVTNLNQCNMLKGTPSMCLTNNTPFPITGVQATSMATWGTNWIPIPGGQINPGDTKIVTFPAWSNGCVQHVVVRTPLTTHSFPPMDVCKRILFQITAWN